MSQSLKQVEVFSSSPVNSYGRTSPRLLFALHKFWGSFLHHQFNPLNCLPLSLQRSPGFSLGIVEKACIGLREWTPGCITQCSGDGCILKHSVCSSLL